MFSLSTGLLSLTGLPVGGGGAGVGSLAASGAHTVKILGFTQTKLHKGFYAKNGVPYICEDDI